MNAFVKITEKLARGLSMIAGVALVWMMVLLVGNIALRAIATPIYGTYELVQMSALFVLGLALADAQVNKSHVAIDLVMKRASKRVQLVVGAITTLLAVGLFAQLASALFSYGMNQRNAGSTTEALGIPFWPSVMALVVAVAFLVLALLADLVKIVQSAKSSDPTVDIW